MSLVKILPKLSVVLLCLAVSGCSLQHHTERAERVWLNANSSSNALHSVSFSADMKRTVSSPTGKGAADSFLTANGANTYLRGQIESPEIDELSGIAPIVGERDKYWAINDSGNRPELFAFKGSGKHLATIDIPLFNRDWEDLASFTVNGENWLAISETGDNLRRYAVSSIYFFKQPNIDLPPERLTLQYKIDFSYEDGPKNVESMAVSVGEGKIYLIAKDSSAANIYTLPLTGKSLANPVVARKVGQLSALQPTVEDTWWERWFAGRVLYTATGLDFSADDRMAVVSNYRHVYFFQRIGDESWATALARTPRILTTHRMEQSESVAFSADSREVIVSSEGVGAPLLVIRPSAIPPPL